MGIESDRQRTVFLLENCMSPSVIALDLGVPYFSGEPYLEYLGIIRKRCVCIDYKYIYICGFWTPDPWQLRMPKWNWSLGAKSCWDGFNIIGLPKVGTWLASGFHIIYYIYICIYIYIYIYSFLYVHNYTHTYINTYIHTYIHTYI